jgi:hypothetical protein
MHQPQIILTAFENAHCAPANAEMLDPALEFATAVPPAPKTEYAQQAFPTRKAVSTFRQLEQSKVLTHVSALVLAPVWHFAWYIWNQTCHEMADLHLWPGYCQ